MSFRSRSQLTVVQTSHLTQLPPVRLSNTEEQANPSAKNLLDYEALHQDSLI